MTEKDLDSILKHYKAPLQFHDLHDDIDTRRILCDDAFEHLKKHCAYEDGAIPEAEDLVGVLQGLLVLMEASRRFLLAECNGCLFDLRVGDTRIDCHRIPIVLHHQAAGVIHFGSELASCLRQSLRHDEYSRRMCLAYSICFRSWPGCCEIADEWLREADPSAAHADDHASILLEQLRALSADSAIKMALWNHAAQAVESQLTAISAHFAPEGWFASSLEALRQLRTDDTVAQSPAQSIDAIVAKFNEWTSFLEALPLSKSLKQKLLENDERRGVAACGAEAADGAINASRFPQVMRNVAELLYAAVMWNIKGIGVCRYQKIPSETRKIWMMRKCNHPSGFFSQQFGEYCIFDVAKVLHHISAYLKLHHSGEKSIIVEIYVIRAQVHAMMHCEWYGLILEARMLIKRDGKACESEQHLWMRDLNARLNPRLFNLHRFENDPVCEVLHYDIIAGTNAKSQMESAQKEAHAKELGPLRWWSSCDEQPPSAVPATPQQASQASLSFVYRETVSKLHFETAATQPSKRQKAEAISSYSGSESAPSSTAFCYAECCSCDTMTVNGNGECDAQTQVKQSDAVEDDDLSESDSATATDGDALPNVDCGCQEQTCASCCDSNRQQWELRLQPRCKRPTDTDAGSLRHGSSKRPCSFAQ